MYVLGTSGVDVKKPVTATEEDDYLKPPTMEGGPEDPEDEVQVDGQGRCYGGGGRGWYGGNWGGYGNWGFNPFWG